MDGDMSGYRFVLPSQDGYVRVEWNEGVSVTEQDAADLIRVLEEVNPGLCEPMLVILNSMVSLDAAALSAFASRLNVAAMAIVGPSAVDRLLATFFNDVHHPRYPTRYFPEPQAALDWLLAPGHSTSEP